MRIDISPKREACLVLEAREQGLSVDAFLERLLDDTGDPPTSTPSGESPQLLVWDLGLRGGLHRRDIYADAG